MTGSGALGGEPGRVVDDRGARDERDRRADERDRRADARERHADARERRADAREFRADDREAAADLRDARADERDRLADERERELRRREETHARGRGAVDPENPPVGLTPREYEVLGLIAEGLPNEDLARRLYLGVNTIKTHIRAAYRKIGATNRAQAVRWYLDHRPARED